MDSTTPVEFSFGAFFLTVCAFAFLVSLFISAVKRLINGPPSDDAKAEAQSKENLRSFYEIFKDDPVWTIASWTCMLIVLLFWGNVFLGGTFYAIEQTLTWLWQTLSG